MLVWSRSAAALCTLKSPTTMMFARLARPVVARAAAPVQRRTLTQTSAEARRYSFAHAADDIMGTCGRECSLRSRAETPGRGRRMAGGRLPLGVPLAYGFVPPLSGSVV